MLRGYLLAKPMGRLTDGEVSGCLLLGQLPGFHCASELPKGKGCQSDRVLTYPLSSMDFEEGRRHQNLNRDMVDLGLD